MHRQALKEVVEGGGSGYVKTYLDVPVTPESVVSYSIGKGGDRVVSMSAYDDQKNGLPGSESWFKSNSIKALGGNGGRYSGRGGDGGSGGGSGRPEEKTAGYIGGSDGSNGAGDMPGIGQGSTTRCPFNNKLYAGGDCGGATENGLFAFLEKCIKDKIKVDNLYVISDMQIGDGESIVWEKSSNYEYGKFAELLKKFKKVNPNCKIVSISIQGYGSEMFYRGSNILNIAGWSESIFDVINSKFCGYKNMIEEIKKIKI